jgi:hypothetical protein
MCMAVYVAANAPLPLNDYVPGRPFHTANLAQAGEEAVGQHFTKPHVVYVGSYDACGCGFFSLEDAEYLEPEEVEAARQSLAAFVAYLDAVLVLHGSVELFTCWEGEQDRAPVRSGVVTTADIASGVLKNDERALFTVRVTRAGD